VFAAWRAVVSAELAVRRAELRVWRALPAADWPWRVAAARLAAALRWAGVRLRAAVERLRVDVERVPVEFERLRVVLLRRVLLVVFWVAI
jgi:hypothetical protein